MGQKENIIFGGKMMFKKLMFGFLLFCCGLAAFGQVGTRHVETNSGYSICPPRQWEIMEYPGQPNKMFVEPAFEGFPAMMTFVSSSGWTKTLEQKFQEGLQSIKQMMPGYKAISTLDFVTNKGLKGKKHIYAFKAAEYNMRGIAYSFLSPSGYSVTITCGALYEYGDKFDKTFDESVATLEFFK